MALRKARDYKQVLLMRTVNTYAQQPDATPESLRKALDEMKRALKGYEDTKGVPKSTRYREVLRMLGGTAMALWLGNKGTPLPIAFVVGTIMGEEGDRTLAGALDGPRRAQWRATQREIDDLRLRRLERQVVERFYEMVTKHPELAEVASGALPSFASRPGDTVAEILERHPEFRQMRLLIETSDAVERSSALMGAIKDGLADLDARLERQNDETAKLAEEMKSERQRQIDAELDHIKIEGLRGAASVASIIIGWENPKLGQQVGAVANAGIDIYKAAATVNRLGESVTGLAATALTGNVLAAIVSVIDVFIDTGPTPDEQVLEAVQQLGRQVQALHKRMDERFDALDVQIKGLGIQISDSFEIIVANQRDMQWQLEDLQASLKAFELVSDDMLAALLRQGRKIEVWFEDMHITPCLIHGKVHQTISPDRFAECRHKLAAAGQSTNLEGEDVPGRVAKRELEDYTRDPDDMTNAALQAFRNATTHEKTKLPAKVPGPERWVATADRMDELLGRWPAQILPPDRNASTEYAETMRKHRASLRQFTESVRRDLFRHASGRPENAFGRVFEDALSAHRRLHNQINRAKRNEIALGRAHFYNLGKSEVQRTVRRTVQTRRISDTEAQRIVDDLINHDGRSSRRGLGEWDLSDLFKTLPQEMTKREFADELVEVVQGVLNNRHQWEYVRYLVRQNLVKIIVLQGGFSYNEGWLNRGSTQRWAPTLESWEEHPDQDRFYDEDDWLWTLKNYEHYELDVRFIPVCERKNEFTISGRGSHRFNLELRLGDLRDEILSVRDSVDGEWLVEDALKDLEKNLGNYNAGGDIWLGTCYEKVRELYMEESKRVEQTLKRSLAHDENWRRDNAVIDLAAASIKSWVRVALFDAIAQSPALQDLMDDTITMRSPERLMREGASMWRASMLKIHYNEIERLKDALATAEIQEWLREHYGHEGVMRTLFVGIDQLPDGTG